MDRLVPVLSEDRRSVENNTRVCLSTYLCFIKVNIHSKSLNILYDLTKILLIWKIHILTGVLSSDSSGSKFTSQQEKLLETGLQSDHGEDGASSLQRNPAALP